MQFVFIHKTVRYNAIRLLACSLHLFQALLHYPLEDYRLNLETRSAHPSDPDSYAGGSVRLGKLVKSQSPFSYAFHNFCSLL
jgi:hypothetical protein